VAAVSQRLSTAVAEADRFTKLNSQLTVAAASRDQQIAAHQAELQRVRSELAFSAQTIERTKRLEAELNATKELLRKTAVTH